MREWEDLVHPNILKILRALAGHDWMHLTQLAQAAHVPAATLLRFLPRLVKLGYVDVMKLGKMKVYALHRKRTTWLR